MKVYIYPTYTPSRDKSGNLYIKLFHDAFRNEDGIELVNRAWKVGIGSLFLNLDADVFIIQWVDMIPRKKFGKLQFILFLLGVRLLKWLKKKIVWVLHNKKSHTGDSWWVDYGMAFMAKMSTLVIAHAKEGESFFDRRFPAEAGKCHYLPHPVYSTKLHAARPIKYDYVIWGAIDRRKNILEFLKYASESEFMRRQRILICGLCRDAAYLDEIQKALTPNVTFINRFVQDEELSVFIEESNVILFTYGGESVLSSGALIYSLNFNKMIIGPNVGNFRDLPGIVYCYNKMEEIETIPYADNSASISEFVAVNTWETFPEKLLALLD